MHLTLVLTGHRIWQLRLANQTPSARQPNMRIECPHHYASAHVAIRTPAEAGAAAAATTGRPVCGPVKQG